MVNGRHSARCGAIAGLNGLLLAAAVGHRASIHSAAFALRASIHSAAVGLHAPMHAAAVGRRASLPAEAAGLSVSLPSSAARLRSSMLSAAVGLRASMHAAAVGLRSSRLTAAVGLRASMHAAAVGLRASSGATTAGFCASLLAAAAGLRVPFFAAGVGLRASMLAAAAWLLFSSPGLAADRGALFLGDPAALPELSPDPAAALRVSPGFAEIVRAVTADLDEARRALDAARASYQGVVKWFRPSWLTSSETRFVLSAVVHRPDRALLAPETCGETRLIYRLERQEDLPGGGGLPFMMGLVYKAPREPDCAVYWRTLPTAESLAARSADRIEINLQSSRWTDDGHGHFLDQVRYLMRVFEPDAAQGLRVAPLENTPDVDRVAQDPALRAALRAWIAEPRTLAALDQGRALLPARFLATRAESVTPLAQARLANRPFSAMFQPDEFASLHLAPYPRLQTPAGLVRRLDTLTCVGCHQSASMAGFHVLGREAAKVDGLGLRDPFSAHFAAMQSWREAFAAAQHGVVPDPEHVALGTGAGAPCGLGDAAFAAWTCGDGLVCAERPRVAGGRALGACVPRVPGEPGTPCETAALTPSWRPERDDFRDVQLIGCAPSGICASTLNGFPGGMCSDSCSSDRGSARCVQVPLLGPFSMCRDAGGAFTDCLAKHGTPALMARCLTNRDCRPDYVCLEADDESGICSPPYVSPRLSVEHHP